MNKILCSLKKPVKDLTDGLSAFMALGTKENLYLWQRQIHFSHETQRLVLWSLCWHFFPCGCIKIHPHAAFRLFYPGYLQACRALMIIALLLGLFSMIVSIMGLKCITIGSSSDQAKSKMAGTGGILFILAGEFIPVWGFLLFPLHYE